MFVNVLTNREESVSGFALVIQTLSLVVQFREVFAGKSCNQNVKVAGNFSLTAVGSSPSLLLAMGVANEEVNLQLPLFRRKTFLLSNAVLHCLADAFGDISRNHRSVKVALNEGSFLRDNLGANQLLKIEQISGRRED